MAKGVGIICKARPLLNASTLITLYYSFIYPHLTYGIEVWGACSAYLRESIFKLQKRAIRIISGAPYRTHTRPLFESLNIMTLDKIYIFCTAMIMFKCMKNVLLTIIKDMFIKNEDIHRYSTRNCSKLVLPRGRTTLFQGTFRYKGVLIWNHLSEHDLNTQTFNAFKNKLKMYLLNCDTSILL